MPAALHNAGTVGRSSRQMAEIAQGIGGETAAAASNDGITVVANALARQAPTKGQLLADVARRPSFPDSWVQLEGGRSAGAPGRRGVTNSNSLSVAQAVTNLINEINYLEEVF